MTENQICLLLLGVGAIIWLVFGPFTYGREQNTSAEWRVMYIFLLREKQNLTTHPRAGKSRLSGMVGAKQSIYFSALWFQNEWDLSRSNRGPLQAFSKSFFEVLYDHGCGKTKSIDIYGNQKSKLNYEKVVFLSIVPVYVLYCGAVVPLPFCMKSQPLPPSNFEPWTHYAHQKTATVTSTE